MPERSLTWADADLKDGHLTVPIEPPPDEDWGMAFGVALRTLEQETRGQQFEGWHVDGSGLQLSGVEPATLKPTADFFDLVVERANREWDHHLAKRAHAEGTRAARQEADEAAERAAVEELRKRE